MEVKKIKNKTQYLSALERFEEIFEARPGSPESDEADILALVIKDYEEKHYAIEAPDHKSVPQNSK